MRNIINKNTIFSFILGMLLCSGIVYAASYYAKDVMYTSGDENWKVSNVNEALDSLYNSSKESKKILIKENYECNWTNASSGGYGKVMTHTIDISDIEGYEKLNADNFIIEVVGVSGGCNAKTSAAKQTSKEYDPETGTLTLSNYGHVWNQQTNNGYSQNYVTVNIWLIK